MNMQDTLGVNEVGDVIAPVYYKGAKLCPNCHCPVDFDLIDLSMSTNMEGTALLAIKYIVRFKQKNGIEDLEKANECITRLIDYAKETQDLACLAKDRDHS